MFYIIHNVMTISTGTRTCCGWLISGTKVVVVAILDRECECTDGRQDFELLLVDAEWIVYIHLRADSGGSAYVHVTVTYVALGRRQDERDGRAVGSEGSM